MNAKPIVPWIGGKRRIAEQILRLMPEHTCYVEAFCGAAAVFFTKEPVKVEVLNDINGDLVTLYRVLQHHLDEFVRQFRWALASRMIFEWTQATPPATLTDIQRAARSSASTTFRPCARPSLACRCDAWASTTRWVRQSPARPSQASG